MKIKTAIWHQPDKFFKIVFFYELLIVLQFIRNPYGLLSWGLFLIPTILFLLIYRSHSKFKEEALLSDEEYQAWLKQEQK